MKIRCADYPSASPWESKSAPQWQKIRTEGKKRARREKNTARTENAPRGREKAPRGREKARTERKKRARRGKCTARTGKSTARMIKSAHGAEKARTERKKRARRRIITDLARKCAFVSPQYGEGDFIPFLHASPSPSRRGNERGCNPLLLIGSRYTKAPGKPPWASMAASISGMILCVSAMAMSMRW